MNVLFLGERKAQQQNCAVGPITYDFVIHYIFFTRHFNALL